MMVDEAEFIVFRLPAAHNLAGVPMCRAERRASGLHDLSHCRPVWLLFSWLAGVAAFSTTQISATCLESGGSLFSLLPLFLEFFY